MDTIRKHSTKKSRRDFAKIMAVTLSGSRMIRSSILVVTSDEADIEVLTKLATEGSPARLTSTELADLAKAIHEGQGNLAKIRDFKLPTEIEPAFVFRAK